MRVQILVAILLAFVVTVTPVGLAETVSRESGLSPTVATPTVFTSHTYTISVAEGQEVTAKLSWDDPNADLDLTFDNPNDDCSTVECFAFLVLDADERRFRDRVVDTFTCQRGSHGDIGLGPATETETIPAKDAREIEIQVSARTGIPQESVRYTLTLEASDGDPPSLGWPETFTTVSTTSHCREAV